MICNCLGEKEGFSPEPTKATKEVQNNISTMPVLPSSKQKRVKIQYGHFK
jgi:hypothetical protein